MKRPGIALKIGLATAAVAMAIMATFGVLSVHETTQVMREYVMRHGIFRANMTARVVRNSLVVRDYRILSGIPEIVVASEDKLHVLTCSIVDTEGKYIVHSDPDLNGTMVKDADLLELMRDEGFETRFIERPRPGWPRENELLIVAPVYSEKTAWGMVALEISLVEMDALTRALWIKGVLLIALLMGGILAAVTLVTERALRPLRKLKLMVDGLAGEGKIEKIDYESDDEIGALTESLNKMTDNWKEMYESVVRRRSEADAQRRLSDAIVENIEMGILVVSRDGIITRANSGMESQMALTTADIVEKTFWDVFPGWEGEDTREIFRQVLDTGDLYSNERVLYKSPFMREELMFDVSICPMKEQGTNSCGALVIFLNLTDKVLLEDHLLRVNEELQRANVVKSDFLSIVSHELRTPLTLIKMYSAMFAQRKLGELTEKQEKAINVMNRRCHDLNTLIDDLLDLSRIESTHLELNRVEFDLKKLVDELLVDYENRARARELEFRFEIEENLPPLFADRDKIARVINNLVQNALKFTESGHVLISGGRHPTDKRVALLCVSDTGPGVSAEHEKKIFDKFYQIDGSDTRKHSGSGLGLSIAKEIAAVHGGRLWLESGSNEDGGATFNFIIPFSDPGNPPPGSDEVIYTGPGGVRPSGARGPRAKLHGDGRNVLLVDNDTDFLEMMTDILAEDGYNTIQVSDGIEAIGVLFSDEPVDIILLDVKMPKLSGYGVLRMIRTVKSLKNMPVLMLTAAGQTDQIRKGYDAGANGYIIKPFTLEVFKKTMIRVMEEDPEEN